MSLEYFLLSVDQNTHNKIYEVIYKFCLEHKVTPPYKDSGALDLQAIETVYDVPETLYQELTKRCSKVPKTVSMNYFRQMLINNKALQQKKEYNIILN